MIRHYFKLAGKTVNKNKYYTVINVSGLVLGMLSALIIAKYIGASFQFDRFHLNRNEIYVISQQEISVGSQQKERTSTYLGVADLISQMPEAAEVTRYYQHVESLVIAEKGSGDVASFTEKKIFIADSSFFKIFNFPFFRGNETSALNNDKAIVLTRSVSAKYFGDTNPIGKTLTIRTPWGQEKSFQVSGVTEDIPKLS